MDAQVVSIIAMFVSGIGFAAIIDLWRLIDQQLSYRSFRKWLFFILEMCIWLLAGILTFYILFVIKGGVWRFVDLTAQLIGFYCYEFMFQRSVRAVYHFSFYYLLRPIFRITRAIFAFITAPIRFVIKKLFLTITNG